MSGKSVAFQPSSVPFAYGILGLASFLGIPYSFNVEQTHGLVLTVDEVTSTNPADALHQLATAHAPESHQHATVSPFLTLILTLNLIILLVLFGLWPVSMILYSRLMPFPLLPHLSRAPLRLNLPPSDEDITKNVQRGRYSSNRHSHTLTLLARQFTIQPLLYLHHQCLIQRLYRTRHRPTALDFIPFTTHRS